MKIKRSLLVLSLVLTLALGITIGAGASDTLKAITAKLNYGITIKYNGEVQALTDATGTHVYPISYNDTTYLPVRAVSNMLGIDVQWDEATQTVLLGSAPVASADGVDLINTFKPYSATNGSRKSWNENNTAYFDQFQSTDGKTQDVSGMTLDHWILAFTAQYAHDAGYTEASGYYNLGGQFNTLTFKAYSNANVPLYVYGDNGVLLAEFSLKGNQVAQTFTVPLNGTTELRFKKPNIEKVSSSVYIFDAYLK